MKKITTAEEALKVVKSGDFVYIHGGAAVPEILVDALVARAPELKKCYHRAYPYRRRCPLCRP